MIVNGQTYPSEVNCINVYDRGLTLGHGLFETILISNGNAPLLHYHWKRLVIGVHLLGIKLPFDVEELSTMIDRLVHDNKLTNITAGIRLTITDGVSDRGLLSTGEQTPTFILTTFFLPKNTKDSMTATIVGTRRNENSLASRIKSISYLDNILAKKEALSGGFDEAFLLNSKSNLAEGSVSNVFMIKNKTVFTPPIADGALPGVIRDIILNELILDSIEVKEQSLNTDSLLNADEVFITNTLIGVKSITKLDKKIYQEPFVTTRLISAALKKQFNTI